MHVLSQSILTQDLFNVHQGRLGGYGRTLVMGIVNVTPDSFSDGGTFYDRQSAISHARRLAEDGADILDIGGESTRPQAHPVSAAEEWARVGPVLKEVIPLVNCPVSIDTYKAETADRALSLGARIVNDVWGLQADPAMEDVIATHQASVILMHNQREIDPHLDIIATVLRFLEHSLTLANKAGIAMERIAVDPGIGFGKTLDQNLDLIAHLDQLKTLGLPVLLGASRKSMIDKIIPTPPPQRLPGTLAVHSVGIWRGADIIRAHDVAEALQAARITDRLRERSVR
jgi:dihydropteroate synthase